MKFSRYGIAVAATTAILGFAAVASADTASCPVITAYMRQGLPNDKAEVTRLQLFLKGAEGIDVDVNGIYDQKTEDAVKIFQKKYADEVLAPWGATLASGTVYITTAKKINQLACASAMTLNEKELSVITDYQSGLAMASDHVTLDQDSQAQDPDVTYTSAVAGPSVREAGQDGGTEVAAAANASIMGKFWFFLKTVF